MAFPHSGGISGLGGRAGRRVGGAPLEMLDAPENLLIEAPRQGFSGMLEKAPRGLPHAITTGTATAGLVKSLEFGRAFRYILWGHQAYGWR